MTIRPGTLADAPAAARLHASAIHEGFLPTLGPAFLTRLYRRIVRHPGSFLLVADDGGVEGFIAGTDDVGALYKSFALRDGVLAGIVAAPRVVRSWRRVWETLRYPASEHEHDLPPAELLAVAVDPSARGKGLGRELVAALQSKFERRGVTAARVTVAAHNDSAIALYERCGFTRAARIEVHEGTPSEVLVWS